VCRSVDIADGRWIYYAEFCCGHVLMVHSFVVEQSGCRQPTDRLQRAPLIQPLLLPSTFWPISQYLCYHPATDIGIHCTINITLQPGYLVQCLTRVRVIQPRKCGSISGRIQKCCSSAQHLHQWVKGALYRGRSGRGVKMTTHLYAVPNLKISQALEPFCTFLACTGTTLPFLHSRQV
jgi:hypothetical protein